MPEAASGSKIGSAFKWIFTSVFGIASGAALMYLTPLLNNAVKPPEPVANFGFQPQGLTIAFQNKSTNATDGWWDFGDGTALEPFAPKQDTISHTYTRAGSYMVKLSLTNLFNEKSERTVTVNVDTATGTTAPVIEQFEVTPLSPGMAAPAVFHVVAKVKNADQLIWVYDGARQTEITGNDASGVLEKWITANDPGRYTFRLAAMSGKQLVEMSGRPQLVSVPSDPGTPMATVKVTYADAVQVEHKEQTIWVRLPWVSGCSDSTCPVHGEHGWPGYQVVKAELIPGSKESQLKGAPKVEIAADKSKVTVTGDMLKPNILNKFINPACQVPVKVTLEKRLGSAPKEFNLPMALNVPGKTAIPVPPLPSNWQCGKAVVTLDLKEGTRSIWSGTTMPNNQQVVLKGRPVAISAAVQGNQLVVTVVERAGVVPAGGFPQSP